MESKLSFLLLLFVLRPWSVSASGADSLFVEDILEKSQSMDFSTNEEKLLFFAASLQGVPYGGGMLDKGTEERLVVRTDSLDCTTYVETVLAMYLASKYQVPQFEAFSDALKYVRYRGGKMQGYPSRLHYFSDWVEDNGRKGLMYEVTCETTGYTTRTLSLDYMTKHKELYPRMKDNAENVQAMEEVEKAWVDYRMPYIPKDMLDGDRTQLDIDNGDIIALTTNIEGLDVLHLGFAYWIDGKLHLLHASSVRKKVVLDEATLYEYLLSKKKHTGVRVVRVN